MPFMHGIECKQIIHDIIIIVKINLCIIMKIMTHLHIPIKTDIHINTLLRKLTKYSKIIIIQYNYTYS